MKDDEIAKIHDELSKDSRARLTGELVNDEHDLMDFYGILVNDDSLRHNSKLDLSELDDVIGRLDYLTSELGFQDMFGVRPPHLSD